MNEQLAKRLLRKIRELGCTDFCLCPAGRNQAFVFALEKETGISCLTFYEERSAAFFALGRARQTKKPVAILTTSGTAAGELLPATMEAYHSGVPLILITADRPRRYRGTGAPQTTEQRHLFSDFIGAFYDIEGEEECDFNKWNGELPLHLNVSFEDKKENFIHLENESIFFENKVACEVLDDFLSSVKNPLLLIGTLEEDEKEALVPFLLQLNAPLYLEATSLLRGDHRLKKLQILNLNGVLKRNDQPSHSFDGFLRLGGIPTHRLFRDLEGIYAKNKFPLLSISRLKFSGLTCGSFIQIDLKDFFLKYEIKVAPFQREPIFFEEESLFREKLEKLIREEKKSSPALMHALSVKIPNKSHIYLGNSLPIREWDLNATLEDKEFLIRASRGLNGIDGQFSTFLGLSTNKRENFAILGDLTTLYDMAAPWILPQLEGLSITLFVINNGGGKIFETLFSSPIFQNNHTLSFEPLAKMWNLDYELWEEIPNNVTNITNGKSRLIEIRPDNAASSRFYKKLRI